MSSRKNPEIILHALFENESDETEIMSCVASFWAGDPGDFDDEDEVLGFMRKSIEDTPRHGVYETRTGGRVHVIGDNEKIMVMPDIIFAQGTAGSDCTINKSQHIQTNL